jgi:YHS domain-containing protein
MKKLLAFLLLPLASLVLAEKPVNTGWLNNIAIKGYDAVAYHSMGQAVEGDERFSYTWREAEWRFSTQSHLNQFKADPERYAPQYGGYCAYAMADGKKVSINPEAWHIEDGRLYLNYSKGVNAKWLKDIEGYIERADSQWANF